MPHRNEAIIGSLEEKVVAYVVKRLDPKIEVDGLILLYVDGELDAERAAESEAATMNHPADRP